MKSNGTTNESKKLTQQGIPKGVIDPCVHCGFCLPTCASYRVLGTEMDSPRGRIHTLKAIENGELEMDLTIASHFDTCLGCFACVSACPSGVRYDELIEATRPKLNKPGLRSSCQNLFRKALLWVLPYPRRLRIILQSLRGYAGTPLQKAARLSKLTGLLGPQLEAMESLLPPLSKESFIDEWKVLNPAKGKRRGKVGFVLGCVQRCFDPSVNKATIAVLQANGFEVVIPPNQGCCGAVTHHQGDLQQTRQLATALVNSFRSVIGKGRPGGAEPLEAIVVAASGCGHTMKEYKKFVANGGNFDAPVTDVHEFLIARGLSDEFLNKLQPLSHPDGQIAEIGNPLEVVYHDACHMIHGQGIATQPRELLGVIPYLKLKEPNEAGICCGSAGIYNLVQPETASELGKIKVENLKRTEAKLIASGNIGCTLQLRKHLNNELPVAHPIEILAHSAGLHKPPSL